MAAAKRRKHKPQKWEDDRPKPIKGRLFQLPRSPVPWGILDLSNVARCGYCGKPIKPFTNQVLKEGEKRKVPRFYTCSVGCEQSGIQRVSFLDKKLLSWMKERLDEKVGDFIWGYDEEQLMAEFNYLTELAHKRRGLQTDLVLDAFHAPQILEKLKKVEREYDMQKHKLDTYDQLPFNENPLIGVMLEEDIEKLADYDINFRKKMLHFMIYSVRIFREYILIRAVPITDKEYEVTKGLGPQASINLSSDFRSKPTEE
ncbi:MAG: hypothetical protein ACLFSQ_08290 [Candidatus Zixiibacteriota bacterium]